MGLKGLVERILGKRKKIKKEEEPPTEEERLLVLGKHHYDLRDWQVNVLNLKVPCNTTCLNFPAQETKLELVGLPLNEWGYKPYESSKDNLKELVVKLACVDCMRPMYALTQDGRFFLDKGVGDLNSDTYSSLLKHIKELPVRKYTEAVSQGIV